MRRRRAGEDVGHWKCCEVRRPGGLFSGGRSPAAGWQLWVVRCPLTVVSRRGVAKGKVGSVVKMGKRRKGAPDPRQPSSGIIHVPQVRGPSGPATNAPAKPPTKEEKNTNAAFLAGMRRSTAQNSSAGTSGSKRAQGLTSQAQITPAKHQKTAQVQPRPRAPT